jgi:hypothetical protein
VTMPEHNAANRGLGGKLHVCNLEMSDLLLASATFTQTSLCLNYKTVKGQNLPYQSDWLVICRHVNNSCMIVQVHLVGEAAHKRYMR